jgi:hypothetical protein
MTLPFIVGDTREQSHGWRTWIQIRKGNAAYIMALVFAGILNVAFVVPCGRHGCDIKCRDILNDQTPAELEQISEK